MPTATQLEQWDRDHYWHSFTQMSEYQPLVIDRAEGCTLIDIHGRRYVDGVSSMWCNVHGHRHPRLSRAIVDQLERVAHCTSLGMGHASTVELARRLVELAPPGLNHVFFSSDGSSAVEAALKIAFQYWRQCDRPQPAKTKFVAISDAYHGDTLGSVSVGGVDLFTSLFEPLLFETLRVPAPDLYRLPPGITVDAALAYYLRPVERLLAEQAHEIAALVVEPLMQCAAGMLLHPSGYLRALRELTSQHNVLLIADEVAVGCGRSGKMFACEQENVSPDLLCLGKGLTGGYLPMAATLVSTEVYAAFLGTRQSHRAFYHGHTFSGNPLASAAALASLELFDEERTLDNVARRSEQLKNFLDSLARHPHVGQTRQCGLMAGVELVADRATQTPYPPAELRGQRVCRAALERGIWIRPLGDVIVIMPPLSIDETLLAEICTAIAFGIEQSTSDEQPANFS